MKRKQLAAFFCASMLAVTGTMAPFTGMTTYAAEAAEETQSAEASVEDQTSAADAAAETDADQQEESEQEEGIETAAEPVEETEESEDQAENSDADVVEEISEDSDEDEDSESINTEETSEEGGTQQDAAAAVEEKIENEEGKEAAKGVTAIVLNETEIELKTDETFQLTASVNTEEGEAGAVQDYTIEWSSDNSRIAQVDDNGLVTAKKHGNTSIHASVEGYDENGDYYQYSAACSVNVTTAMEGTCGDNLTWKIDEEGNLVISGTGEMYDYTYVYDYDYDEYVSTAPFSEFRVITLVIDDGVTSIGDYAFYNQDSLSEITFYPSLQSIGSGNFYSCDNLSDVNFEGKITEWNTDVHFDSGVIYHVYDTDGSTRMDFIEIGTCGTEVICAIDQNRTAYFYGEGTIDGCLDSDVEKIVIKEGVTGIGSYVFEYCTDLKEVYIPVSLGSIEYGAFGWDNEGIKDVYYAGTINQWFDAEDVSFGGSTPVIHSYNADGTKRIAFYLKGTCGEKVNWTMNAHGVVVVSGRGEMEKDYDGVFGYRNGRYYDLVTEVNVKTGVTSVSEYAFSGCDYLTNVTLADSVRKIGYRAFAGTGITSITIPSSVREIYYNAFDSCTNLRTVNLPAGIESVAGFTNCTSLENITIPKGVKSISSFSGCTSLKSISIPMGVTSISSFDGCTSLTSMNIPDSVRESGSFEGCTSLSAVRLSPNTRYIYDEAFKDCTRLTKVINLDRVREIGKDAFSGCTALKTANLKGAEEIEDSAFENCSSLTTISLSLKIKEIGYYAFDGCSKLSTVNYDGTAALWKKIKIGKWNDPLTKAKKSFSNYTKSTPELETGYTGYGYDNTNTRKRYIKIYWNYADGTSVYDDTTTVFRIFRKGPGDTSWVKVADVKQTGSYYDYNVKWGTYQYTVRCMSSDKKKYISDFDRTGVTMKNWLDTPTLTTVSPTASGVQLKWKKSPDAAKYRVFRKTGSGSWVKLTDTTSLSYLDKTAKSGTKYTYTVRCMSGNTYTSELVAGKTITFIAMPKLGAVANVTGGIKVTWSRSAGAAKYRVFRKTGSGKWVTLADTTALSYVDKTAKKGTKYTYTVRCVSADGKTFTSAYNTTGLSIVKK